MYKLLTAFLQVNSFGRYTTASPGKNPLETWAVFLLLMDLPDPGLRTSQET
jgi:hypothetical protein